jgi:hypothetical protein
MTGRVKVLSRWERFKRLTVWHPINTDPADEDRWGPRFWFPTYDVIAIILGLYAYYLGSPLLNRLFPPWLTDMMGLILVAAAVVCLIGVCFPILNYLELAGKLAIVFILGSYAGTVWFMATTGEPNGFVVIILVMAVWLLGPRITKLFTQVPKNPSIIRLLRFSKRRKS